MQSLKVTLKMPTRVQPEVMPKSGKAGVYTNKMHYFKKHVLDELAKKDFAMDFMHPVDTEELQMPGYYEIIHQPMDLGTITKRVENNYYRDVFGAISDFHLMLGNYYSTKRSEICSNAEMMEMFFMKAIGGLPQGPGVPWKNEP